MWGKKSKKKKHKNVLITYAFVGIRVKRVFINAFEYITDYEMECVHKIIPKSQSVHKNDLKRSDRVRPHLFIPSFMYILWETLWREPLEDNITCRLHYHWWMIFSDHWHPSSIEQFLSLDPIFRLVGLVHTHTHIPKLISLHQHPLDPSNRVTKIEDHWEFVHYMVLFPCTSSCDSTNEFPAFYDRIGLKGPLFANWRYSLHHCCNTNNFSNAKIASHVYKQTNLLVIPQMIQSCKFVSLLVRYWGLMNYLDIL